MESNYANDFHNPVSFQTQMRQSEWETQGSCPGGQRQRGRGSKACSMAPTSGKPRVGLADLQGGHTWGFQQLQGLSRKSTHASRA